MDFDQPSFYQSEPKAAAPATPTQQVPTQQVPTQQVPTQQVPTQQAPTQQVPTQQVPLQQAPTQQVPTQQKPVSPVSRTPIHKKKRPSYWALHYADNWSLVFGLLACISLGSIFPFSVIAIVISQISKKAVGVRKGGAKAGMIMGIITLILSVMWFIVFVAISIIFILNNLGMFG